MASGASRRSLLRHGLCLCCLPGLASAAAAGEDNVTEVADGIFLRRGADMEATAANRNGIANIGFVVGRDAVLVTDAGGSLADGRWLRSRIRERTDKPIRHVVISHVHPDHCLGVAAFAQDQPNVIGHYRLRAALDVRGDFYRERLIDILGAEQVGSIVPPTQEIGVDGAVIDLGARTIRFSAHRTAHTDCDLTMVDTATGLLFAADLLFVDRVPALDGSLPGWLAEVQGLRSLGAAQVVPGHGPAVAAFDPSMTDLQRYLTVLLDETRAAIAANKSIVEAIETVGQSERGRWKLFDDYHGRNVTQAYKELEWE